MINAMMMAGKKQGESYRATVVKDSAALVIKPNPLPNGCEVDIYFPLPEGMMIRVPLDYKIKKMTVNNTINIYFIEDSRNMENGVYYFMGMEEEEGRWYDFRNLIESAPIGESYPMTIEFA